MKLWSIYREAYSGLPGIVWGLSAVVLVNRMGSMVMPFLTLYLVHEFQAEQAIGILIGIHGLGGILGVSIAGRLCDRIGYERVLIGSLLATGGVFVWMAHAGTLLEFGVSIFVLAMFSEAHRPASNVAIANACSVEQRSRAFALQRLAINVGMTIGPAIGGYLAERDYHWLFWADSATCIAAGVLVIGLPTVRRAGRENARKRAAKDGKSTSGRSPWRDREFLTVMALLLASGLVFFNLFSVFPLYLSDVYRLSESRIGLIFAVNTSIIVAVEMVLVHRLRYCDPLRIIAAGSLFLAFGLGILPYASGFAYAVLCMSIFTIGEMLIAPNGSHYTSGKAPKESLGRYLGVYSMVFSLGRVIGPAFFLYVYHSIDKSAVWHLSGLLSIAVAVGLWSLRIRRRPALAS